MGIMISISQASELVNLPFDIADEGTCQVFSSFCQYYVFWPGSNREKKFFPKTPCVFASYLKSVTWHSLAKATRYHSGVVWS